MKLRDWLDPNEFPCQLGMTKEYAIRLFMKRYSDMRMNTSKIKNIDVWYSCDRGRYMINADYYG